MANGLGPRTLIVSIAAGFATDALYQAAVKELGEFYTIAGVDGTIADGAFVFALQGTHAFATGDYTGDWVVEADFDEDSFVAA